MDNSGCDGIDILEHGGILDPVDIGRCDRVSVLSLQCLGEDCRAVYIAAGDGQI